MAAKRLLWGPSMLTSNTRQIRQTKKDVLKWLLNPPIQSGSHHCNTIPWSYGWHVRLLADPLSMLQLPTVPLAHLAAKPPAESCGLPRPSRAPGEPIGEVQLLFPSHGLAKTV